LCVTAWLGGDVPGKSEIQGRSDGKAEGAAKAQAHASLKMEKKKGQGGSAGAEYATVVFGFRCCGDGHSARVVAVPDSPLQGELS